MQIKQLPLSGIHEITLSPFEDERGCFMRVFDQEIFKQANLPWNWVQENVSINKKKGILRGLHFILPPHTDGKLIRCTRGRIWDVVVDLRKSSPTQGQHLAYELSEDVFKWIDIPKGFAHGFCTLTDKSELVYKHDTFYHQPSDAGILWSDPDLNISWPAEDPLISEKDRNLMTFAAFISKHCGL
jgi:dTDP-4-dehydrorhamnose 3,5-epimerase